MFSHNVRVPKPLACIENVLVMDYVGDDRGPAPLLKTTGIKEPEKVFLDVVNNMKKIHKAGLVHGDLSEYNILMWKNKAHIIDVAQAISLDNPMSEERFQTDVKNIARYFAGSGVKTDREDLIKRIRGA